MDGVISISLITVNYNDKEGLSRTLESVVNQSFKDFQHIIVDANSLDLSLIHI